jgi:putative FmdB family regulatory protein
MPIYEYECPQCGVEVEKLVRKTTASPPFCEGKAQGVAHDPVPMRKKVSQTDFQLKGGGWYKDGYG